MIPFLIATAIDCEGAENLIAKIRKSKYAEQTETELIQVIKDASRMECWDAKAD